MSSASIRADVKALLAEAAKFTGSPTAELIYRVVTTQTGNPLVPATTTASTLLPDANFKSYKKGLTDTSIQTGDRMLVSNSDNVISQGDTIRQGTTDYIVIAVDEKSPAGEPLVYISQVRQQ